VSAAAPRRESPSRPADPFWPDRRQLSCFVAAWAGWVLDAFDFSVYLLVLPDIALHFRASLTAVSTVVTATLVFRVLGGLSLSCDGRRLAVPPGSRRPARSCGAVTRGSPGAAPR